MDSIERRMAALFLLLMSLVLWQAVRTHPLHLAPFVSALEAGEQVFPVAVPPEAPLRPPAAPAERLAFLKEHAVEGFGGFPADACEAFVRMSAHHWLRLPVARERLPPQPAQPSRLHLADTGWLTRGGLPELRASGPGAEVEVFCPR